jgi:hypothetical protein
VLANQLQQLADGADLKEGQAHLRNIAQSIDAKTAALVSLLQETQHIVHEGFAAALQAERIEIWIQKNPVQTHELLALGRAVRAFFSVA